MINESEPRDILVIGGGASGALVAWNLAIRAGRTCTLIDPADHPALGLAYGTPSLRNLLNVPAKGMSADPDDPDHFLRWLHDGVSTSFTGDAFVPRAIYGLYLRTLLARAAPEHRRTRALSCRRDGEGYRIALADGTALRARRVVLACGHFDPARLPGIPDTLDATGRYHHDAWSPRALAGIGAHDDVVLIGTGLTTVDILLRLRENGHRGRIIAISGHGRFPARHGPCSALAAPIIAPDETAPTARAYLRAFHGALTRGVDWRAAVDSLRPVSNDLWRALPDSEKSRLRRHLARRWDIVRHRMARHVADIIEAERHAGSLVVRAGRVVAVDDAPDGLRVSARGAGENFAVQGQHVINCTGPSLNYARANAPLLHGLMDDGDIAPGFGGAGLRCTPDGALIGRDGAASRHLFTVGPARLGVLIESIAIPEIRSQARALADRLAREPVLA